MWPMTAVSSPLRETGSNHSTFDPRDAIHLPYCPYRRNAVCPSISNLKKGGNAFALPPGDGSIELPAN